MALLNFKRSTDPVAGAISPEVETFLQGYSIEVMPRTAVKVDEFRAILPKGTRVYIAHIEGTPIDEMVSTAARLNDEGFDVMPHFPARIIHDQAMLADWIARYQGEANVDQALLLAGGVTKPHGDYHSSMQMMESGEFDKAGFKRLHVAGHPEGNRDIDPNGGMANVEDALRWKQDFSNRTDAEMALATQFAFESGPIIEWAKSLKDAGIDIPIHIGIAGPAKLQTMIKFAIACGVGPSLRVLQRRAKDVTKLLMPFEPTDVISELAAHTAANPDTNITKVHFFPLGGIKTNANWAISNGGNAAVPVNAS